jgi:hypothetical protein
MTKDYALASIRSWIGDECPAVSVGALIAQLDHLTALESCADSLYLRRKLLQFFMRSGIDTYMRKVILVATERGLCSPTPPLSGVYVPRPSH